jgi:hypothetical protein
LIWPKAQIEAKGVGSVVLHACVVARR